MNYEFNKDNIPCKKYLSSFRKYNFQDLENVFLKLARKYSASSGKYFSGYVHEQQGQQAVCGEQGGVRPEAEDQRVQEHSMVDIFQFVTFFVQKRGVVLPDHRGNIPWSISSSCPDLIQDPQVPMHPWQWAGVQDGAEDSLCPSL